jgi:hypothetical protein
MCFLHFWNSTSAGVDLNLQFMTRIMKSFIPPPVTQSFIVGIDLNSHLPFGGEGSGQGRNFGVVDFWVLFGAQ